MFHTFSLSSNKMIPGMYQALKVTIRKDRQTLNEVCLAKLNWGPAELKALQGGLSKI